MQKHSREPLLPMTSNFQQLRLRQLDAVLTRWRIAALPPRPGHGWIRAIRNALGMSSATLAQRLQITGSGIRKLEESEASDAITLSTLRRVAAALDCELQYALVPKESLADQLQTRAMEIARERVGAVARSMALEDQSVDAELTQSQIEELARTLLAGRTRDLW